MTNLESVLKSRDITLMTKLRTVKAMIFPAVMYGSESWTTKKAEHQRTNAFKLWCWRRFLRVPWTAGSSNQTILKEISPEYSLEGLMRKLQHFGHLMCRANSLEKTLTLGKDWGQEGKGVTEDEMVGWHHWLNDMSLSKLWEIVKDRELACCSPWGRKELDITYWLKNNNMNKKNQQQQHGGSIPLYHRKD